MDKKINATVATAPLSTGVGRYAFLLHNLHFSDKLVFYKKSKSTDSSGYEEVVTPSFSGYALNALLSFVYPTKWGEDIQNYNWAHITTPDYFHLVKYNKNLVGTVHDLFTMESKITAAAYSYAYRRFIQLNFKYVSKLKGVVAISENSKSSLEKKYPNVNVSVVRNWEEDVFRPRNKESIRLRLNLPKDKHLLLNVGSTEPRKNLKLLVRLMKSLPDNYILLRIGSLGTYLQYISNKKIIQLSQINDQDYALYFNAADVYLAPSFAEGFNRPLIQALKSNLPIIASDIDIHKEILQDSSYLLSPLDSVSWIEITKLICEQGLDPSSYQKIHALSKYYSIQRASEEMSNFYKTVLSSIQ